MSADSAVEKGVLLVGPQVGELHLQALELSPFGVRVERTDSFDGDEVSKRLDADPTLSLLMIDGVVGKAEAAKLVADLRRTQVSVPVLFAPMDILSVHAFGAQIPDSVLNRPFDAETLHFHTRLLLSENMYPAPIREAVENSVTSILGGGFNTEVALARSYFKANRIVGGEVAGVLPFAGAGFSGRMAVSGAYGSFERVLLNLVGSGANANEVVGLAGELANEFFGRVKDHLQARGLSVECAVPAVTRDASHRVPARSVIPSVAMVFEGEGLSLHVEFGVDVFDPALLATVAQATAATDDVLFF